MPNIIAARSQMAMSLLMVAAKWLHRRTGDDVYLLLARLWATGTAIMFAVGAVSGTVLSFELGLLWPHFMRGPARSSGCRFRSRALFFYRSDFPRHLPVGRDRVSPRAHLAAGVMVAFFGVISGVFVGIANSWMNTPVGFRLVNGLPESIDPIAALTNPAALNETVHMTIAAYAATGFVVAGIHAAMWLRDRDNLFHRRAIEIAFTIGAIAAMMQPISGDASARAVAHLQPLKMEAFEGLFHGGPHAPLALGGIPDVKDRKLLYAIELPSMLSIMTYHSADAVIPGLDSFPEKDWPVPMIAVHLGLQIMVGAGFAMAGLGLWGALLRWWRGTIFDSIWFMRALVAAAPLGLIAVEAGWVVTEVGSQPWIIYGVMRKADAVTPMPGLMVTFALYSALYLFLGATVVFLIWRQVAQSPTQPEVAAFSATGP